MPLGSPMSQSVNVTTSPVTARNVPSTMRSVTPIHRELHRLGGAAGHDEVRAALLAVELGPGPRQRVADVEVAGPGRHPREPGGAEERAIGAGRAVAGGAVARR